MGKKLVVNNLWHPNCIQECYISYQDREELFCPHCDKGYRFVHQCHILENECDYCEGDCKCFLKQKKSVSIGIKFNQKVWYKGELYPIENQIKKQEVSNGTII